MNDTNISARAATTVMTGTPAASESTQAVERYLEPDKLTKRLANPIVAGLTRLGISVRGSRVLEVQGRVSGEWREVPVNPLTLRGRTYLVAPRGHTQWVRNLRVAGTGRLRRGRRRTVFTATELADADKAPIIRAYLAEWAFEVGKFFDGITKDSSDDELLATASGFPVFEIHIAEA
jgi:deazaflavin-dependent oxidoreductase (nitroreductase family)